MEMITNYMNITKFSLPCAGHLCLCNYFVW